MICVLVAQTTDRFKQKYLLWCVFFYRISWCLIESGEGLIWMWSWYRGKSWEMWWYTEIPLLLCYFRNRYQVNRDSKFQKDAFISAISTSNNHKLLRTVFNRFVYHIFQKYQHSEQIQITQLYKHEKLENETNCRLPYSFTDVKLTTYHIFCLLTLCCCQARPGIFYFYHHYTFFTSLIK